MKENLMRANRTRGSADDDWKQWTGGEWARALDCPANSGSQLVDHLASEIAVSANDVKHQGCGSLIPSEAVTSY